MDIELKDRASRNAVPFHTMRIRQGAPGNRRSSPGGGNTPPSPQLVREVSRAAGQFQRSAMGHLDHQGWHDRMERDGQHLMDLLAKMGFNPSE